MLFTVCFVLFCLGGVDLFDAKKEKASFVVFILERCVEDESLFAGCYLKTEKPKNIFLITL